jgi:hypothetical protein
MLRHRDRERDAIGKKGPKVPRMNAVRCRSRWLTGHGAFSPIGSYAWDLCHPNVDRTLIRDD